MNYNNAKFFASYGFIGQLPAPDRAEIVFIGRSNVGKSSMINKLLNRKNLARASAEPGKTATINFYELENIFLVDLPGYGYAKTSKSEKQRFSALIGDYLSAERSLGLVIQLINMRHPPTNDDIKMINALIDGEFPFIVALTKADKLSANERIKRREALKSELPCASELTLVEFSSQTGEGAEQIREIIESIAEE